MANERCRHLQPVVAGLCFYSNVLVVWFSKSVMPYRIPGAVDYANWPILQILHIEKRGLQFHERCISIDGYAGQPRSVSFSDDVSEVVPIQVSAERGGTQLPAGAAKQVQELLLSANRSKKQPDPIRPIRAWNADTWYFYVAGGGYPVYETATGSFPPQEIVDLFNQLSADRHSSEREYERRDVCLGFCYDPLSAMGLLYANHRCFTNTHGTVCR